MRLIKLPEVMDKTGLGKTTVYKLLKENAFPVPVTLIGKSKAWVDYEVEEWIEERILSRDRAC